VAAYLIAEIDVTDPEKFAVYREQIPTTLEPFGGHYLARGGAVTPLEGGWNPGRIVVIEFPDMASLQGWYESDAYGPVLAIRQAASNGRVIAVEGI